MAEYIEREILLNTLDKVCRVACPYSERRDIAQYVKCGACPLGSAFDFIDDIPSADVRPVVRGKWVQTGGKYSRNKTIDRRILTCSVCGNFLHMEGVNAGRGDANFCPNCGADMREES